MSALGRIARAIRAQPALVTVIAPAATRRLRRPGAEPTLLIGTHHKVLTVYLNKVFSLYGAVTGRSVSTGRGPTTDPTAAIIHDDHSAFSPALLSGDVFGIHVRRDPRDLLVSAAHYHKRAEEPQLLTPRPDLDGRSYRDHVNALETFEEVLLFEITHSAGRNVRDMVEWDYASSPLAEVRYEDLVSPRGVETMADAIERWPIRSADRTLVLRAFEHFSALRGAHRDHRHVRDPRSGQWTEHFTPAVQKAFDDAFPGAVSLLGYDAEG